MKEQHKSRIAFLISILLLAAFIALPLTAQDATEEPGDDTIMVVGAISIGDGGIVVGDYNIAPASAFTPSSLEEGDIVIITGELLPDGQTIQADSLELFVEEEPEVTETPDATDEPEVTVTPDATDEPEVTATPDVTEEPEVTATPDVTEEPEVTATPDATDEPEATAEPEDCPTGHPVAARLSEEFGVSAEEIEAMHCDGNGFGEIARAFLLSEQTGTAAEEYLAMHQAGEGWGNIVRETGVHPSDLAPGRVIGRGHQDDLGIMTPEPDATDDVDGDTSGEVTTTGQIGNGNGNGNANGNGGNGNGGNGGNGNANGNGGNGGNGNANGNSGGDGGNGGNGNGNSNGGGNGNGNGNGNGGNN